MSINSNPCPRRAAWIRTEGHAVALAAPREAEVPRLGTGGWNKEGKAVCVGQGAGFAGRLGLANREVRKHDPNPLKAS